MNAATFLAIGVTILCVGWLWFYIVRPILEDFGVIRVNDYDDAAAPAPVVVMSRSEMSAPVSPVSSKDGQSDGRTDSDQVGRAELLTLYKVLRKYGIPREEIRPALKGVRVVLSNDVWASAAADDAPYITPIVGRSTSARFETDADFPYQAPAH